MIEMIFRELFYLGILDRERVYQQIVIYLTDYNNNHIIKESVDPVGERYGLGLSDRRLAQFSLLADLVNPASAVSLHLFKPCSSHHFKCTA